MMSVLLLCAYLHQDLLQEHRNAGEAIECMARELDESSLDTVVAELGRVARQSGSEIRAALEKAHCAYLPEDDEGAHALVEGAREIARLEQQRRARATTPARR